MAFFLFKLMLFKMTLNNIAHSSDPSDLDYLSHYIDRIMTNSLGMTYMSTTMTSTASHMTQYVMRNSLHCLTVDPTQVTETHSPCGRVEHSHAQNTDNNTDFIRDIRTQPGTHINLTFTWFHLQESLYDCRQERLEIICFRKTRTANMFTVT